MLETDYRDPSCPWAWLKPAFDPFCEKRICGWLTEPANCWTNLAYIVVGLVILYSIQRRGDRHLSPLGWLAIAVGFGSGALHCTSAWIGSLLDLSAMYLLSCYLVTVILMRLVGFSRGFFWGLFGILSTLSIATYVIFHSTALHVFVVEIVLYSILEIGVSIRARPRPQPRFLIYCGLFFVSSFAVWQLDIHRIWCNPDNHWFNGHGLWHLLNAWCYYCFYRYFGQFSELKRQ